MAWLGKIWGFPICIIGALILFKSFDYFQPDFSGGFLIGKEVLFSGPYKWAFYAHIISAPIALFAGTIQAFVRLEKKHPNAHKAFGLAFLSSVIIAAPSGFIMAFSAIGGWLSTSSFILLSTLWFVFALRGFWFIQRGVNRKHRQFMTRAYVLTLSAVFLRLWSFICVHYLDWYGDSMYIFIAWASWLPFLAIYEFSLIWKKSLAQ